MFLMLLMILKHFVLKLRH